MVWVLINKRTGTIHQPYEHGSAIPRCQSPVGWYERAEMSITELRQRSKWRCNRCLKGCLSPARHAVGHAQRRPRVQSRWL
jgi:hypothetical protein